MQGRHWGWQNYHENANTLTIIYWCHHFLSVNAICWDRVRFLLSGQICHHEQKDRRAQIFIGLLPDTKYKIVSTLNRTDPNSSYGHNIITNLSCKVH